MRPEPWRIITRPAAWLAKKSALDVDVDGEVVVGLGDFSALFAGPEPALLTRMSSRPELDDGVDGGPIWPRSRHVHRHAERSAAHRHDLGLHVVGGAEVAEPEGDVGAGVGEGEGDGAPDARAAPVTSASCPARSKLG